jgi:hypothetical protein
MALRRQSLSPTANLLRNSRLFSLPNPLPRPVVGETSGAGVVKASDSATLPYPTHQAIATTKSSLARGDWGLKRNLPARSHLLQTSDPVLRITQLDTIEDVTDFDSAADHVRTRQKWEEMGVPMMKGSAQRGMTSAAPDGAFERRDDTTSYDTDLGLDENGLFLQALKQSKQAREKKARKTGLAQQFTPFKPPPVDAEVHNSRRWKHEGPWLPGQGADEYTAYISKEIGKRQAEFNEYLVEFVKNEIYTTRQLAASQSGELPPIDAAEAQAWQVAREKEWADISQDDISASIKTLRKEAANTPLTSKLVTKLITPFLRLPAIKLKEKTYHSDSRAKAIEQYEFDKDHAPLSTHPSAGLGYLKTKAYLATHPILGPQRSTAPIPARVVQPRQTSTTKEKYARLGVSGFVANDEHSEYQSARGNFSRARDVETIDINTPGGKKILVNPQFGSVSNDGRVHIKLSRSSGPEVAVARGALEDRPPQRDGQSADFTINFSKNGNRGGFARKDQSSGVPELDALSRMGRDDGAQELSELSEQGKQFAELLQSPARGQPGPGFPGVADALRPSE